MKDGIAIVRALLLGCLAGAAIALGVFFLCGLLLILAAWGRELYWLFR